MSQSPSRRDFFKGTGGLLIGFSLADATVAPELLPAAETASTPSPARLDAWLRIEKDGSVKVFTGKVDIGMGVQTGLSQIVAEELDVLLDRVSLVMGDTAETPDQGGVGGSTSIATGARPLRNAAATARYMLVQLASGKLGVQPEALQVKDGVISAKDDDSKSVSYADLAGGTDLNEALKVSGAGAAVNVEGKGKPKDPSTYKIVGSAVPRLDVPPKIFGQQVYSTDIRVPGMLHGRVIRPSGIGATLVSVDDSSAKKVPGFAKTVVKGNFVGVVAESEWAAIKAAKELKVNWSSPAITLPDDLYAHMRAATPKATREGAKKGDAAAALSRSATKLSASYEWPFQAHATMGPGCVVADVKSDGVTTVWCGAQKPHALQHGIAELLGVPPDRVRIVWVEDAGSYGRAGHEDVAGDAALLSQAAGKPVRLQWSRADMTQWGGKGPATIVDVAAGLDEKGGVTAFQYTSRAFSGMEIVPQAASAGNLLAGQLTGSPNSTAGDEYVQVGAATTAYAFPNIRSVGYTVPAFIPLGSPLRTTHLRDPGGPAGTFAGESFIDEIAAAAGIDPIEFRLKYLEDARAKAALNAVAERAKWERRSSPNRGGGSTVIAGRGVALIIRGGTYVATVAEVEVDTRSGAVKVKRLVCAHDCGLIVNPEALRTTIAANLIQSTSRAVKEEVTFDRANVTSVDWKTYPVLRSSEIPEVEILLLNHPEAPSTGAGEPSSRPTAAAINNAIFDATGARVRQAPLTPARVKIALGAMQRA